MKKIVRLTESDLTRIVRRVIRETQEKEMEEGWLGNLFGGKKEEPKGSSVDRSLIDIDGVGCKKVYRVLGFTPMRTRYYKDKDGNRHCLVGSNYSHKAHSGTFDDEYEAKEHMDEIGALSL